MTINWIKLIDLLLDLIVLYLLVQRSDLLDVMHFEMYVQWKNRAVFSEEYYIWDAEVEESSLQSANSIGKFQSSVQQSIPRI